MLRLCRVRTRAETTSVAGEALVIESWFSQVNTVSLLIQCEELWDSLVQWNVVRVRLYFLFSLSIADETFDLVRWSHDESYAYFGTEALLGSKHKFAGSTKTSDGPFATAAPVSCRSLFYPNISISRSECRRVSSC